MNKNLEILLQGLDIMDISGDPKTSVRRLAYDSRRIEAGDLFIAIQGTRLDGRKFILDATRRGANVIVSEGTPENGMQATFVRVPDARKALARLSMNYFGHPSRDLQIIGITGTNGKTTTSLLLEAILKNYGLTVGVLGTLAYRWGEKHKTASMTTPESFDLQELFYEMRKDRVSHLVMEVSSHALALGRVEGCQFGAAVFTNLSQDHLDFHSTMENYFSAKAVLFKNYLSSVENVSVAVINQDDPYGRRLMGETRQDVWSYSLNDKDARVWVRKAQLNASGILAELATPVGDLEIRSPLLGRLNLYNLLAAATTALALEIPKENISRGLESVSFVDGRLQRIPIPPELGFEVVVDYAHTPDAMEKSLSCLREMTRGRLLAVFGCGGDRDRAKRPLMGEAAASLADLVIVTSDNPRSEAPEKIIEDIEPGLKAKGLSAIEPDAGQPPQGKGYTVISDRKRAISQALSWACPGDIVFIGGKGHETYQIIADKVLPFDDREAVLNHFASDYRSQKTN
ncbi:MAG: UDP-N-acetylmuramoyl-L-alanyl-D-glutamate--2,6-diaminopimelate ligase [Syntrophobacteraceae bacterium]